MKPKAEGRPCAPTDRGDKRTGTLRTSSTQSQCSSLSLPQDRASQVVWAGGHLSGIIHYTKVVTTKIKMRNVTEKQKEENWRQRDVTPHPSPIHLTYKIKYLTLTLLLGT